MRIDRQLANTHGGFGFGTTKTHAAVRTIPVPAHVTDMLAAHLAEFPAGDDGLIFTMVVTRQNPAGWWPRTTEPVEHHDREACAVAGVVDRTRTHDLRHVAASALIAGALSVAAVQAVLGNASPAETLEVYTHLWPTDEERTRAAIEAASASWMRVPTAARA